MWHLTERKLIVNPKEAQLVCDLYQLYLQLGCVSKLKSHLDRERIKSDVEDRLFGRKPIGWKLLLARGALRVPEEPHLPG